MKRNKRPTTQSNMYWILAAVALVIVLIIIFSSGTPDGSLEEVNDIKVFEAVEDLEPVMDTLREEVVAVESKKVGEEGLCEDYFFEEGDELHILDHAIKIERIGKDAVRVLVDGENYALNGGDSEYLGNGIRLSINEGNILYFSANDPTNAVVMRVGCQHSVNPNEKYVQDRGEQICEQMYTHCQEAFDIDE